MIRTSTFFTLFILLSALSYSNNHLKGDQAKEKVLGAEEIWYKTEYTFPSYIKLSSDFVLNENDAIGWLKAQFKYQNGLNFIPLRTYESKTGVKHAAFSVKYNDVTLEFIRITIHSKNGVVKSISGNILPELQIINTAGITKNDALRAALDAISSETYKWEVPAEEEWLKTVNNDPMASYFPAGELVIISKNADYRKLDLRYAYKFDVNSQVPMGREEIYVDAQSSEILFRHNQMHHADTTGTAFTGYSGMRPIITTRNGGLFRLEESVRHIHTWNLQNTTAVSNRIDFVDNDNFWQYSVGSLDKYALDAHWGAEMSYDFFKVLYDRDGIDNAGFEMNVYVHYGEAYNNAFWNGNGIHFGDGNLIPYSTLDIVGHEITHGLTDYTADLIYSNESGALNESFSDIFGNCIEFYAKHNFAGWRIGEDRGNYLRDMSAPNIKGQPDTYEGLHWYVGPNDNGGVHTNSGVQNHWFYLLSEGGNGINDKDKTYSVNGIGIYNAAWIAYETLAGYLTPISDYEDAWFYSIVAALDSFKRCDVQHEAIVKAWYAVGFGKEFVDHTVASFNADRIDYCNAPFTVNFTNNSDNAVNSVWDFGDGAVSTLTNPSHTYSNPGEYTVTLTVNGGELCGNDQLVRDKYIQGFNLSTPKPSSSNNVSIKKGESISLFATTDLGEIHWYSDQPTKNRIHIGSQFQTPAIFTDVTYYLKSVYSRSEMLTGEKIQSSLLDGLFSSSSVSLLFDVKLKCEIISIYVNAGSAGNRNFQIKDSNGNLVFEKNVYLEAGVQEVKLNAAVSIGTDYEMGVSGGNLNLWRSTNGSYPYESLAMTITGNSLGSKSMYPYLFDWKVKEEDCESNVQAITVSVETNPNKNPYNFYVGNSTDFDYYIEYSFDSETNMSYGLYGINGQMIREFKKMYSKGSTTENVNELFNLDSHTGGVYFITMKGGKIEKTEKIVNKGGSN